MDWDRDLPGHRSSSSACPDLSPPPQKRARQRQTAKDRILRTYAKSMRHTPTDAEAKLWAILRDRRFSGFKFRRQMPIGDYIADLVCVDQRLIIEADGSQHNESRRDIVRDAWFRSQGFRVRRFWNTDILLRPTEVKDTLWAYLNDGKMDL